ncbi:MAG: hypothetical protein ACXQS8_01285 [Candidatus Helarchaeales archaeon]
MRQLSSSFSLSFACDSNDRTLASSACNLFSFGFSCRERLMGCVLLVSCSFPVPSWLLHLFRRREFLRRFLNDYDVMGARSTIIHGLWTRFMDI